MGKRKTFRIYTLFISSVLAGFMFLLSMRFYGEYRCLTTHYPEKFLQVELMVENEMDLHKNVLDKGKAIYDRTYVVENVKYRTEIASKEFDDIFYVCEDNPREVFSEYDIEHCRKKLVFAIIISCLGIVIIGERLVLLIVHVIKQKNI